MLQRYTHLCSKRMAHKLDEVFKKDTNTRQHKGRKFLSKAGLKLARPAMENIGLDEGPHGAADGSADHATPPPDEPSTAAGTSSAAQPSGEVGTAANVIRFPTRRRA